MIEKKCNSDESWNNNKCLCECKKHNVCKKINIWNRATRSFQNGKYLANIMDDSGTSCDEIINADAKTK